MAASMPASIPLRAPTVVGALLNFQGALARLGDAVHQPPYKSPPKAPVLYVKPRNTWAAQDDVVRVPHGVPALQVGATLGLVVGRPAHRLRPADALQALAGYRIVNDVSVPHDSFFRPAVRFNARDGFCPMGPIVPREQVADPDALELRVFIDGDLRQRQSTSHLVRDCAKLLADVSEFMTLWPGDVLLVGVPEDAPLVHAGQRAAIEIDGLGRLENRFDDEALSA